MKHINLLLVLLAINTNIILGSIVPVEKAQRVARNAYYERIGQFDKSINSEITFEKPIIVKAKALPVYYVFNSLSDNSFIVVSADDIATPVLAFSSESKLNPDNCIPPVKNLLAFYEEQILFARENNYEADKEVIKEWQYYASQNFTAKKASKADYLLNSLWDQDIYFNNACPLSNEGKTPSYLGGRVYAGCDATAMAQIIRYHTYPKSGKGTKTYSSPTSICPGFPKYGPLTVNFAAQTYNYSSMPYSNITASNCSEIAKLLYHCGVAMEMCYSIQGSGAYIYSVASAYTDYFDYTSSPNKPTVYSKDNSDASVWEGAMKAEIDAKRPVHYAGNSSSGNDGHAFVLDGYSGSTFHFNFGWKGSQNGFYSLSAIKVTASSTSHNYSYHQFAILPIIPKSTGPVVNIPNAFFWANPNCIKTGESVYFTDLSTNTPTTWLWTFNGGTPKYSDQKNPVVQYTTAGKYSVSLKVTNSAGSTTKTYTDYIQVGDCSQVCDTLYYPMAGTASTLWYDKGWVFGTNGDKDRAFSEFFWAEQGTFIKGCLFHFGRANGTGNLNICVWDKATVGPGNIVYTAKKSLTEISSDIKANRLTYIHFEQPYKLTEDGVYIGIQIPSNSGDTIAIKSNLPGETAIYSSIWIQGKSSDTWYTAQDVWQAQGNVILSVYPLICPETAVSVNETKVVDNDVYIYPNPSKEVINIITPGRNFKRVKLYNLTGKLIKEIENMGEVLNISTSGIEDGVYFIRLEGDKGIVTRKVIVNK